MAAVLWGDMDGKNIMERRVGRGRIVWGLTLREILQGDGFLPDFVSAGRNDTLIDFIHRSMANEEIYFLSNRSAAPEIVSVCCFP
jgi:hypothetical protein